MPNDIAVLGWLPVPTVLVAATRISSLFLKARCATTLCGCFHMCKDSQTFDVACALCTFCTGSTTAAFMDSTFQTSCADGSIDEANASLFAVFPV